MNQGDPIVYVVNADGKPFDSKPGKVSRVREGGRIDLVLDDQSDARKGRRLNVKFVDDVSESPKDGVYCTLPETEIQEVASQDVAADDPDNG